MTHVVQVVQRELVEVAEDDAGSECDSTDDSDDEDSGMHCGGWHDCWNGFGAHLGCVVAWFGLEQ